MPVSAVIDRVRGVTTILLDSSMATRPNIATGNWLVVAGGVEQTVLSGVGRDDTIILKTTPGAVPPGVSPRIEYNPPPDQLVAKLDPSLKTPIFDFRTPIVVV